MTLRDYLTIGKRWWWLVALGAVMAGVGAFFITSQMTKIYAAQAVLLVNQAQNPGAVTYQDILGSQQLTKTYAELATSNLNLQQAVDRLKDANITLISLERDVRANAVPQTQLIRISAEDASPARAQLVANTVAEIFPKYIEEAQLAGSSSQSRTLNTVFVAESAQLPKAPIRPNRMLNVAIGVLIGLVVMVGAVALVEYLDDGIDERADIEELNVPFLGAIAETSAPKGVDRKKWVPSIAQDAGSSPLAEAYRQVQASLAFALSANNAKILLVTSSAQGEGKSTTAANLAEALAESSKRVLLVDGDLRKPDAHRYFTLPNGSGLTSAFLAKVEAAPAFLRRIGDSLYVMTSGPIPPNPAEMLSSKKMAAMLAELADPFDVVIVDSPPLIGLADASLWASLADGVILVARRGKTRRGHLLESVGMVRDSHKPLVGVILNGAKRDRRAGYYYRYGYGYSPGREQS